MPIDRKRLAKIAQESRKRKRAAIPFKIDDPIKVKADAPFRSAYIPPTRKDGSPRLCPLAGKAGVVIGINGEDKELQVNILGEGRLWHPVDDFEYDDDPVLADDDVPEEFDADVEFEEDDFEEE